MKTQPLYQILRSLTLLCVMLVAGCKPSVDDIRSMDDPEKLVEIVLTASKEGWLGDDWLAARAAVDRLGKMSSVEQLRQITLKVPNHQLRYAALDHLVLNLDKISDTKLLTQLSDRLMDPTPTFGFIREVRKETKRDLLLSILKRTKDQVLLAAIVQKYRFGNDPFILEAIANLEDPDILKSLLNDTAANWDRKQAILDQVTKLGDRITDPRLWSEVAKRQYIDDDTRLDAIGRVGNTELLLEVADRFIAHRYSKIPSMVFDHIGDQDDLLAIALNRERAAKLRSLAIEKLTEYDALSRVRSGLNSDQNHLNYIALSGLKNDIKNRLVEMAQQSDDEAIIADLLTQNLNYVGRGTRDLFREKLANGIVRSQALIAKVAIYGWETRAREIAVELLEDDAATLKQVAMNDKQGFVRQAAIKKIDDQKFLAELALSDTVRSYYLSNAATKRITNSALLADIVKNVRWNETRVLAIKRIDDSVIFASLPDAPDHWNEEVLKALQTKRQEFLVSANAVTDPTILLQMAKSHPSHELRLVAVKKLDNQKALAEIVRDDINSQVRLTAVNNISDTEILTDIATDGAYEDVRPVAAEKLTDPDLLAKLAVNDPNSEVRIVAIKKIDDQDMLIKIAREDPESSVSSAAAYRISDTKILAKLGLNSPHYGVRRRAVEEVSDRKTLARIAAKEEVSDLRDTIARKLIKKDMATLPYGLREVFFKLQRIGIDKGVQAHYGYLKAGMQYRVKKYQYGFKGADYGINTLKVEHVEVKFHKGRGKTVLRMKFSGQAPKKEEKFYVGKLEKTNQVEIDFNSICKKLLKPLRENHRKLLWTTTRACLE